MNETTVAALEKALVEAERAARAARGLPPWHVLDLDEFPFAFAAAELERYDAATRGWLAAEPANPAARLSRVFALHARREYGTSNAIMEGISPQKGKAKMRFGVSPPDPATPLPEVQGSYPEGPALFLACDAAYFGMFGIPLLKSIAAHSTAVPLHIHLMAADASLIDQVMAAKGPMTVTATREDPFPFIAAHGIAPELYFGAARLVRFTQALERGRGPLCMLDVDSLANGDPLSILETPGAVGLRVRPGRVEPWNQFSACMVLGRPEGRAYFDAVGRIVTANLAAPWWGLDQYALFSAWVGLRPALSLFGPREADVAGAEGIFLFTASAAKTRLLTDETPYARLFRRYR